MRRVRLCVCVCGSERERERMLLIMKVIVVLIIVHFVLSFICRSLMLAIISNKGRIKHDNGCHMFLKLINNLINRNLIFKCYFLDNRFFHLSLFPRVSIVVLIFPSPLVTFFFLWEKLCCQATILYGNSTILAERGFVLGFIHLQSKLFQIKAKRNELNWSRTFSFVVPFFPLIFCYLFSLSPIE